ncbi:MAG: M20 family metallopeptidase [Limisphaerales bacterium]
MQTPTVRLLCDLIATPSVNPAFMPEGDPRAGEERMAEHVQAVSRAAGLDVASETVTPRRSNVLVRLSPPGKVQHRILLGPHLDTVGFPNLESQLVPRVRQGRVFGRGACDTKGCVTAMLSALLKVARSGSRPKNTEIQFVGFIDEENEQLGSRHHARHHHPVDLAIVGEPTRLEVVTAHKGDVWLRLKTTGRSAHGATPHLGRNAVHRMGRVVDLLETTYRQQLSTRSHPLLGSPTINVGAIRGGTQPNIVPDACTIDVDRRTLPGETEATVRRELRDLLRHAGLKASFEPLRLAPCEALETSPDLPWVRGLCRAAGRRRTVGVHFFCDAAPLAKAGTPSVVFGPGDIAQAHTAEEWISVASLERGTDILERFLRSLP